MWESRVAAPRPYAEGQHFCLEKHTHVLYNEDYEMNKKAGYEGRQSPIALCRRDDLLTQHKYYAPIPILLEIPLFINTESGDLGPCAVLMAVWVNESCAAYFICPGSATARRGRKSLFPSGITVKGKYTHMDGALLAALFLGRSFCFFQGNKT